MMKPANQKPGTMIYFSHWYAPLEILDGEQIKELLKDVLNLAENGEYPESFSDLKVKVFFKQMESAIIHDDEQYQKKIEQRKKAAQASVNARQRSLTVVNESQHPLTDVNTRQRVSTNTIQNNTTQYNTIQTNTIQSNTDQYSSTQTKDKYWGDNKLWELRCMDYGVDPYDPEQRAIFEKGWRFDKDDDIDSSTF